MNNIIYHQVQPDNNDPSGYTEFSTLDFTLNADGRKLNPNSIRIDFEVEAEDSGTSISNDEHILINNKIGGHSFIESYQVETQSSGIIENLQEAARWHATHAATALSEGDMFNLKYQAEGRGIHAKEGNYVIQPQGHKGEDTNDNQLRNPKFSLRPLICLNRMVGDAYSFSKNGYIKVSCNLARNGHAFYGGKVDADVKYTIKNVVLRFTTRPDDGKQGKMMMNSVVAVKSSVNSANSNLVARVPSKAVNGVVINFLKQSSDQNIERDSYALEKFGKLNSVEYRFNDATNKYVTYRVDDYGDMTRKAVQALGDSGLNMANARNQNAHQGAIIGLPFLEYIDLSTSKFSVELESDANVSADPRLVFMFFLTLIEM